MIVSRSATRHWAHRRMRPLMEAFGSDRLSRPALFSMDRQLEQHIGFDGGVFVEAGANDGFEQSNTYYLERIRGWSGVLIEGIPELAERCRRVRRNAIVFNYALVAAGHPAPDVLMHHAGLVSIVDGAQGSAERDRNHLSLGTDSQGNDVYQVRVPARPLSAVLEEAGVSHVDFLSLDLEGYELPALRGLDLTRHRPTMMLIEALGGETAITDLDAHLASDYERIGLLSPHDVLYRVRESV